MLPHSDSVADVSLRDELSPGEYLLWSGRPGGGSVRLSDVWGIVRNLISLGAFAFVAFGFLSNVEFLSFEFGPSLYDQLMAWLFSPYGVILALIILYSAFGRYLIDAARRRRTFYGLTPDRLIVSSGLLDRSTTSFDLRSLSDIRLEERRDGTGTISFGLPEDRTNSGTPQPGPSGFERIPDARRVYETILDARRRASER